MGRQLTKNFNEDEFRCGCKKHGFDTDDTWCHGENWIHQQVVDYLQVMRFRLNKPIIILSGCRCPRYNSEGLIRLQGKPGATMSQHKRGTAVDIKAEDVSVSEMARLAKEVGFKGIGLYDTFTHVDLRYTGYRWDERNGL